MVQLLLAVIYLAFISLGLPDSLLGKRYYHPTEQGLEGRFKTRLEQILNWKKAHQNQEDRPKNRKPEK